MKLTLRTLIIFVFLICRTTVLAQPGQLSEKCRLAIQKNENTSEGKNLTNCVNLGKTTKDLTLCSHSECANLKIPSALKPECTETKQDEVFIKSLIMGVEQFNSIH